MSGMKFGAVLGEKHDIIIKKIYHGPPMAYLCYTETKRRRRNSVTLG